MANSNQQQKPKFFSFEGGFYGTMEKIFDTLALGFLWILFSIPLITIGASTTALYYSVHKIVHENCANPFQMFWRSFRRNFKQATLLWLGIVVCSFLFQLNAGILDSLTDGYVGLFFIVFYAICAVLILGFAIYAFAALSRFDMSLGWIIKLSLFMTMRYFPSTLGLLALFGTAALLFYQVPMAIFFLPAPLTVAHSWFLERLLEKHTPETDSKEEIE